MFNHQELSNILSLIKIAPITGEQAMTVAVLQQKISTLLATPPKPAEKVETSVTPKKK